MNKLRKAVLATMFFSLVLLTCFAIQADAQRTAKPIRKISSEDKTMALKTLNSFYKPALNGRFPGAVNGLNIGGSTRKDVIRKIGRPDTPRANENGYDVYHAEMGQPGYAIAYKRDKIREMRYFGTNVERQTNIGGITNLMILRSWGVPSESVTIRNGSLLQQKITYNRGKYKLLFIFTSSVNLDHISLLKR